MSANAWEPGGFPALTTDLYQLTMTQAYYAEGLTGEAVFDLFVRRLPPSRNYLVACGLESVLDLLENVRFEGGDLEYLSGLGRFTPEFIAKLADFRFEGDVYAMPEGTVFFANEPVVEVVAPLPQAQLVETYLLNQITFQSAAASKCTRVVAAAGDRQVVDFGLRRVHGVEGGISAARAFYIAGAAGTSNVMAGRLFGIPVAGTMAHSYITAHNDELAAFRAFTERNAETVLLVDTYDTLRGVENVVRLAGEQGGDFNVSAIRLDSGDIGELAKKSRGILDEGGLNGVSIFASGGLDEHEIDALLREGAPIDGFGVGTKMGVSADAPYLDTVYKLVAYEGEGRMKLSTDKQTLPHRKQVFREYESELMVSDTVGLHDERLPGEPLLKQVMARGRRTDAGRDDLEAARRRAKSEIEALPEYLRGIAPSDGPYEISIMRTTGGRDRGPRIVAGAEPEGLTGRVSAPRGGGSAGRAYTGGVRSGWSDRSSWRKSRMRRASESLQLKTQSAVDGQGMAGHKGGFVRNEIADAGGNVSRSPSAKKRMVSLGKQRLFVIFPPCAIPDFGDDQPGADCVCPDAVGTVVERHAPGDSDNRVLAGVVDCGIVRGEESVNGRDVDDGPAAHSTHVRKSRFTGEGQCPAP